MIRLIDKIEVTGESEPKESDPANPAKVRFSREKLSGSIDRLEPGPQKHAHSTRGQISRDAENPSTTKST